MFRLIASIPAHDGPIKAISSKDSETIVSGGQDSTVRLWSLNRSEDKLEIVEKILPIYHSHWISAVTSLNPNCHPNYPNGLIVTGCMDNIIRLFDFSGNLLGQLVGHQKSAISFSWTNDYQLVSGSWDGTAKIWNLSSFDCLNTFSNHENGVHVLCLDDVLVTVSSGEQVNNKPANFKLRLWSLSRGTLLKEPIEDHSGPIRSVFSVPKVGFATTSNDGTLCLRDSEGNCVGVCTHDPQDEGYPPFLLDGTAIYFSDSIGGTVTCGEDGSVNVWKGTERFQSIQHPACVWAVCTIGENGNEFVTACHDGFLRVFSRDSTLCDHPTALELQTQLELEVETARLSKQRGPSQEEIQKSPKWEDRGSIPGTSEGQVRIFNKSGVAIAAQWSAVSYTWIEIGEVTGSAGSSDGGMLNGVNYDHIIPVEIETSMGLRKLQLGYNNVESHFTAAQRFIDENMLDQGYLRQIADFIAERSGKSQPTIDMSSSSNSNSAAAARHQHQSQSSQYQPTPTFTPPAPTFKTFPSSVYFMFDDVPNMTQLRKILGKIGDLNDSIENSDSKLSSTDFESLQELVRVLGETSYYHSSVIQPNLLNPIIKTIQSWNNDQNLFPIYDLLRMICCHPSGGSVLSHHRHLNVILSRAVSILNNDAQSSSQGTLQSLLALRFLSNCFKNNDLKNASLTFILQENVLGQFQEIFTFQMFAEKKTHRIANFNFLCNLFSSQFNSLLSNSTNNTNSSRLLLEWFFPQFLSILRTEVEALESIFHGLIVLGAILVCKESSTLVVNYLNENNCQIPVLLNSLKERWSGKERTILEYIGEVELAYEMRMK